jgi:HD-GYP domain-containing protein (c-di-GMP phosphodiesterase class II)
VLTLVSQGQHPIFLDQMSRLPGDAVGHATAVAHLSMVLGLKLERYLIEQRHRLPPNHAREVVNLGVAGMLHDMGKLRLPANLQTRYVGNEPESDDQLAEWQTHARLGYELIRDGVEPSAAIAVLHHHQHFDGSGFPRTIHEKGKPDSAPVGRQIHVFPRIVMVADLYDRLSTAPGSSQRRPNIEILHRIRECYGAWCDPTVLNMLEVVCPPYLPGSRVELSDGTKAVVVSIDPADPYKPGVRRLKRDSLELEDARIELTQPGAPQIRSVGGVSVEQFTYGRAA